MKILTLFILFIVVPATAQEEIKANLYAGRNNKAIRLCHKQYEINGNVDLKYYESIALCMKDYKYPFYFSKNTLKAKDILIDLVTQFPDDGRFHFRLGLCYYRMCEFKSALNEFDRAAELIKGEEWITAYRSMAAGHLSDLDLVVINKLLRDNHDDLSVSENPDMVRFFQSQGLYIAEKYNLGAKWYFGTAPELRISEIASGIFDFEWDTVHPNNLSTRERYGIYICTNNESGNVDTLSYSDCAEWLKAKRWLKMSPENEIIQFHMTILYDCQWTEFAPCRDMKEDFIQQILNLHHRNRFIIDKIEIESTQDTTISEMHNSLEVVFKLDNPNAIWGR